MIAPAAQSAVQAQVCCAGAPVSAAFARSLVRVEVQQRLSQPSRCVLFCSVRPGDEWDCASLQPGAELTITVAGRTQPLFSGSVTELEFGHDADGTRHLTLSGEDALQALAVQRPVRAHIEVSAAELAAELMRPWGVAVQAHATGPVWQRLLQWRSSDLELLADVCARSGLYFFVSAATTGTAGELHLGELSGWGAVQRLVYGADLLAATSRQAPARAATNVQAHGWDPWRAAARAGSAGLGAEQGAWPLANEALQSDAQAMAVAVAEHAWRGADANTVRGVATGTCELQPGARVELVGLASAAPGNYVLTTVTHRLDRQTGYLCEFDSTPPARPERDAGVVLTIGVVAGVDDPEAVGRVCVTLPAFAAAESDWLQVLCLGAGAGKGLTMLPDIGDTVLVLLQHSDSAQGVVLGGVYGEQGPADSGVDAGGVYRYTLALPGGQRLQLDGQRDSLRLENEHGNHVQISPGRVRLGNSDGSIVELARDGVRIHADTDLDLAAPGKTITLRAAAIEFEQA